MAALAWNFGKWIVFLTSMRGITCSEDDDDTFSSTIDPSEAKFSAPTSSRYICSAFRRATIPFKRRIKISAFQTTSLRDLDVSPSRSALLPSGTSCRKRMFQKDLNEIISFERTINTRPQLIQGTILSMTYSIQIQVDTTIIHTTERVDRAWKATSSTLSSGIHIHPPGLHFTFTCKGPQSEAKWEHNQIMNSSSLQHLTLSHNLISPFH